MSDAEDAREVARLKVEAALHEYAAALTSQDEEEEGNVMMLGWVAILEYTQASLEDKSSTGILSLVPGYQSRSTSRGLHAFGEDVFMDKSYGESG